MPDPSSPMPEPGDAHRRKAAQLDPPFANARLIDALERGWEIAFRCQYYGTGKTWRRDAMLGRARRYLNCTMAEIQASLPCPRCLGRLPIMTMSGVVEPGDMERRRWATITLLLDIGLNPSDYGYGWTPPGCQTAFKTDPRSASNIDPSSLCSRTGGEARSDQLAQRVAA